MERIIKLIEEKLESQECTIYLQKHEIKELTRKLEEAEETIEEQAHIINDLKGANA
jgi:dihydropteroate synthase